MKKKIVIFCCQEIGYFFIKNILKNKFSQIAMVISYETIYDKLYGYNYDIKNLCLKNNIMFCSQKRLDTYLINQIKDQKPEYIFSVYSRIILNKDVLGIPSNGCINIHPSLLPKYAGPVPTAWAILNNEKEVGVTIHKMVKKIDAGPIMYQKKIKIKKDETGFELHKRVMNESLKFLIKNYNNILFQKFKLKKQTGNGSYFGKLDISNKINWKSKAIDIHNLIRTYSQPYLQCQSKLLNRIIFINKSQIITNNKSNYNIPGQIIKITPKKELLINCVDGVLKITNYSIYPKVKKNHEKIIFKKGIILE